MANIADSGFRSAETVENNFTVLHGLDNSENTVSQRKVPAEL